MKYFTELLVEKHIVRAEDLVDALVVQAASRPSAFAVIAERKLLPPQDILKALVIQEEEGLSFIGACAKTASWSEQIGTQVARLQDEAMASLPRILLDRGSIGTSELFSAIEEFAVLRARPPVVAPVLPFAPVAGSAAPAKGPGANAGDLFTEAKRRRIATLLSSAVVERAGDTWSSQKERFRELFQAVHEARGSARLLGDAASECLLDRAEHLLTGILASVDPVDPFGLMRLETCLEKIIALVWRTNHGSNAA